MKDRVVANIRCWPTPAFSGTRPLPEMGCRLSSAAVALLLSQSVLAQQASELDPEVLQQMQEAGYETDPVVLEEITTGGQPMGRWKEGITLDGIEPMPRLAMSTHMSYDAYSNP